MRARSLEITDGDFELVAPREKPSAARSVFADSKGRLWFGLRDSLIRIESGNAERYEIVPGKPEESLIVRRIRSGDMPPPKRVLEAGVTLMTAAETDRLQSWIAQGAPVGHVQPDVAGIEPDPLITAKDR